MEKTSVAQRIYGRLASLEKDREAALVSNQDTTFLDAELVALRSSLKEVLNSPCPIVNPRRGIELNGVANISLLIQTHSQISDGNFIIPGSTMVLINEQLELLERYMIAYRDAVSNGVKEPFWHEVRANPNLYPRNNGK